MAGPAPVVGVVGLNALGRDIRKLAENTSSPLFEAVKVAGRRAAEPVAARARSTVPASTTDHAGRLRGDIRVTATRTGAAVRMGRKTVPYAGWVEFGGTRKTPHTSTRPFVRGGRYLFPAAQGLGPVSAALYSDALSKVFASSGVWTNSTTDGGAVHD